MPDGSRLKQSMISTKTIWIAIFDILKEAGILSGQALSLNALMAEWESTHLRQGDLAQGLDTLARAGLIRLEMSDKGPQVTLLAESLGKTVTPEEGERVVKSLEQLSWSRKARRARSDEPSPIHDILTRRKSDSNRRKK